MASNQSATDIQASLNVKKSLFTRGATLMGVGLVSILAITGCDKSADKAPESESANAESDSKENAESVTLEPVGPDASKVCGNQQLPSSLKEALVTTILTQSKTFAAAHAQSSNVAISGDSVGSRASSVVIDVQNIQAANESPTSNGMVTCQASVSMQLSNDDIARAEAMYSATNESSLQQKLAEANITLNDGIIVDEQFRFVVNPQAANPVAQIIAQPMTVKLVSDVMANSSIKLQIDAKAAAEKKARQQAAARRAAAEKKARQQAAARRAAAEKKARQQAAARRAATEQKNTQQQANQNLSLEFDGVPNNQSNVKPTDLNKPKQPTQKANDKLNVKGADQIEMVIIEEEGTY